MARPCCPNSLACTDWPWTMSRTTCASWGMSSAVTWRWVTKKLLIFPEWIHAGSVQVHKKYDLKGSTVDREASEKEKLKKEPTLKVSNEASISWHAGFCRTMTLWRMEWRWRLVRRQRANWWKPSQQMSSSSSSECTRDAGDPLGSFYVLCFSGTTSWITPCCLAFMTLRWGVHALCVKGSGFWDWDWVHLLVRNSNLEFINFLLGTYFGCRGSFCQSPHWAPK